MQYGILSKRRGFLKTITKSLSAKLVHYSFHMHIIIQFFVFSITNTSLRRHRWGWCPNVSTVTNWFIFNMLQMSFFQLNSTIKILRRIFLVALCISWQSFIDSPSFTNEMKMITTITLSLKSLLYKLSMALFEYCTWIICYCDICNFYFTSVVSLQIFL